MFSSDTHVLVTKDGYEEMMAKTTWENTKAAPDGSRDGYHLVASKPPEVQQMEQIKEIKSKNQVASAGETEVVGANQATEAVVEKAPLAQSVKEIAKKQTKKAAAK